MKAGNIIGVCALVVGSLSILPSLVSGIGLIGALASLVLAGVAAALKEFKYSSATLLITTVSIFGFSVFTITNQSLGTAAYVFFGTPYFIAFVGFSVGYFRQRSANGTD